MTSKHIVVFGATGPTGLLFCKKALDHGHSLTIYVRSPEKLSSDIKDHASVKILTGPLTDHALITTALTPHSIVISLLGPNSLSTPAGTFTTFYTHLLAAMRAASVTRILALGTVSIPDPRDRPSLAVRLMVGTVWTVVHSAWKEIVAVGRVFDDEAGGLLWTMFRVGGLANGEEGEVRATYVGAKDATTSVNRKDVAKWLVEQVEVEEPLFVGEKPLICSPAVSWLQLRP